MYFCGNKLIKSPKNWVTHTLFLFDLKECILAEIYSDNSFHIVAQKSSGITNKHRQGGQSSQRFERGRDNMITHWFKRLNEMLSNVRGEIKIGSHEFYKNRFEEKLSEENKRKITFFFNSEYCDESGVWQYISNNKV
jgi:peptide chain release factor subunit 1